MIQTDPFIHKTIALIENSEKNVSTQSQNCVIKKSWVPFFRPTRQKLASARLLETTKQTRLVFSRVDGVHCSVQVFKITIKSITNICSVNYKWFIHAHQCFFHALFKSHFKNINFPPQRYLFSDIIIPPFQQNFTHMRSQ